MFRSFAATMVFGMLTAWNLPSLAATVSYSQTLAPGWNLVGNGLVTAVDVQTTFGSLSNVQTVWKWDASAGKWAFYAPSLDSSKLQEYANANGYSVLTSIGAGEGYWVNVQGTNPISRGVQSGEASSLGAAKLVKGWNLAASGADLSPADLSTSLGNVTALWAWDNSNNGWYFYAPALAANNTLASYIQSKKYQDFGALTLGKGLGFWVDFAGGTTGGGLPNDLGTVTTSNNGAAQFGASFVPATLDSVPDIGLGWQYRWSISTNHFIQLNGSTVTINIGNFTWQKPLAPVLQMTFDAVNGKVTFKDLTTTTAVGGAQAPLVVNGTLRLTPMNSGPVTLAGTGVSYTGTGFDSPVAKLAATTFAEVWTWQDARGATLKLTHLLTNGRYQVSYTGMGATPFLSSVTSLSALGITIDPNAKTATFANTFVENNNTRTSVTVNGVLALP